MKYTTYNVQQLNRKGKPWQARAKYKDVYGKWKETSVLKYQLEYLLSGKESDLENLESVAEQILWIREGINFTYLMSAIIGLPITFVILKLLTFKKK